MKKKKEVLQNNLYSAAIFHYKAKIAEAKAHLEILFNFSVGIGEHTNLLEEVKKWTKELAEGEECLATLEDNF
tara:strand:+ start:542 stop:760 length:219 start_codon:yes stop_codon:yes gene_type:complete